MVTLSSAHQLLLDAWHPLLNESKACRLLHGCLEHALLANVSLKASTDRVMAKAGDQIENMIQRLSTGSGSAESVHEEYLDRVTEYWQEIDDALSQAHDAAVDQSDRIVCAVAAEVSPTAAGTDWTEYCLAELKKAALRPYERCADELVSKRQRSLADLWNMQTECRQFGDEVDRVAGIYQNGGFRMWRATANAYWMSVGQLTEDAVTRLMELARCLLLCDGQLGN